MAAAAALSHPSRTFLPGRFSNSEGLMSFRFRRTVWVTGRASRRDGVVVFTVVRGQRGAGQARAV